MIGIFDRLRAFEPGAATLRMLLACLCGAVIGLERSAKKQAGGFQNPYPGVFGRGPGVVDRPISVFDPEAAFRYFANQRSGHIRLGLYRRWYHCDYQEADHQGPYNRRGALDRRYHRPGRGQRIL